jgi:hypothetical protein
VHGSNGAVSGGVRDLSRGPRGTAHLHQIVMVWVPIALRSFGRQLRVLRMTDSGEVADLLGQFVVQQHPTCQLFCGVRG